MDDKAAPVKADWGQSRCPCSWLLGGRAAALGPGTCKICQSWGAAPGGWGVACASAHCQGPCPGVQPEMPSSVLLKHHRHAQVICASPRRGPEGCLEYIKFANDCTQALITHGRCTAQSRSTDPNAAECCLVHSGTTLEDASHAQIAVWIHRSLSFADLASMQVANLQS